MIREAIGTVIRGDDLDYETARKVMEEMMDGSATQAQMGGFLTALRMKGETIDEITAFATVMREKGVKIKPVRDVMEIVGTGGDEVGTFNISTTAALITAAAGVPVAKHGNRSVSSRSGAADVLEHLGAVITITPEQCEEVLRRTNICFMFAQVYHSSMKYAAPVRKEIGVRTVFNILGPLSNPAGAKMQLMGVYDRKLVEPLAQVLSNLGVTRGFAVCGSDGLDEVTLTGGTSVCEIRDGILKSYEITPEQVGLKRCELQDLIGGTPEENAMITRDILSGKEKGPKRDVAIFNAACAIYLGIDGLTLEDSVGKATEMIDSGAASRKLEEFVEASRSFAKE
ncbi:MAG: anthranilate phosphoribosyltransferase [Lachnospiraceae bacterium]|nr:anthranilate phosphoribosyltransferase [Lachnospiraceae bacterium]